MERYPGPGPPFPAINEDHVWLFHGTTPSNADAIRQFGWGSPDPDEEVRQAASANALPNRVSTIGMRGSDMSGPRRASRPDGVRPPTVHGGAPNSATTYPGPWRRQRLAFRHMKRTRGPSSCWRFLGPSWLTPNGYPRDRPSSQTRPNGTPRTSRESCVGPPMRFFVPALVFDSSIVGIDLVARECSCVPNLWLGAEPTRDLRLRCTRCYVGESN